MERTISLFLPVVFMLVVGGLAGCGEPSANEQLIGGQCLELADCDDNDPDTPALECLTEFKAGYCGRVGCSGTGEDDCPPGSVCVDYQATTYCFLVCDTKGDCNRNRLVENEANCSSDVKPVDGGSEKVCVPPSSGT